MHIFWTGVSILSVVYLFAAVKGPFPYWKSYFCIWQELARNKNRALGRGTRLKLAFALLRIAVVSPLYNIFWLVDELLYPGYRACEFDGPIFIVGPPRSGTTFLHRMLAEDNKQFLGIRHIEWRFPFIFLHKILLWTGLKSVVSRLSYWPSDDLGRLARKMHDHSLGDYEEDGIFFEERFLYHYFIFRRFPYPDLLVYLHDYSAVPAHVNDRMLGVHEKILRKACYLDGRTRRQVILKENESMQMLRVMAKHYSDSKFILLTRRSAEFLSSYVALSRVSTQCKTGTDPVAIPDWHSRNVWKRLVECDLQMNFFNNELSPERQVRLSYELLDRRLSPTISYLYKCLGIVMSADAARRLGVTSSGQKERQRGYELELHDSEEFDLYNQFANLVFREHEANLGRLPDVLGSQDAEPGAAPARRGI